MPNFWRYRCIAMPFPGSPVMAMIMLFSETSTMLPRKTFTVSRSSVRALLSETFTLNSTRPRCTTGTSVTRRISRTLGSLYTCLIKALTDLSSVSTAIVNRALSMFLPHKPTARDSILNPRRAKTPATRLIKPRSSATYTEIVCRRTPSFSNLTFNSSGVSITYTSPPPLLASEYGFAFSASPPDPFNSGSIHPFACNLDTFEPRVFARRVTS
mmetsp:Transcript_39648/g.66534  ORF Transcript_39648/g.66534 Transcript_39648/m.66534 type:complete len:213 (+) Transcript_39648:2400-3038(+)